MHCWRLLILETEGHPLEQNVYNITNIYIEHGV